MSTIYAGPGKIVRGSMSLHAEGAGGRIIAKRTDETVPAVSSLFGTVSKYIRDLTVEIDVTPFDDWSMLAYLYPLITVATGGTTAGGLSVGGDAHDPTNSGTATPCSIWTPDGRKYPFFRSAVTGHPEIHLGIDKAFYGAAKITCLGQLSKTRDDATFIQDTVVETGGTDTGASYAAANIVRGPWTGAYTGTGLTSIEVEDEWVVTPQITYNTYKAQGLSRKMTLANVAFAIHGRPVGPTHTQLATALEGLTIGQKLTTATDFVLTGPGSKTITLKKAQVTMGGFEFGGTQLGTSEIVFHNSMTFTAGVPDPLLTFSA